ncbi:MAG: C4-dicarboxylate ABC transporter [Spirochaetae bacterium HGW-Spirochaetae-3]|jgi:TRAP transporter 4TM/12TM fusion protein|nr:MAG: C4-dicarboxylate ABC transporter [Spirochaetae bacterium HGW-Spirochaetae-3]
MNESTTNEATAETIGDSQDILRKYDKEADYRTYTGFMAKVITAIAITFSCFQLYTALFGVLDAMIQRSIHLAFGMSLIYLLYPTSKKWSRTKLHPLDLALSILGALTPMYIIVNYGELVLRAGTATTADMIVGVIGILLVLEAARRIVGVPIVVIASLFIAYAFAGPYLPGQLAHRGVDVGDLVQHLYFTTEGVFGIPLGVSSTFIFLFILFGAYLEKTGLGQYFIDLANSIAGRAAGGPAKVAVLSSGLMGTVSGSSVANVVGTGSFTIPMMKRLGYAPEFAGAVEATASTGGQLMPPIMGAAAFLMAEMTGIPYVRIIGAAVIPAMLYFFGVWAGVHFEAKKLGLRGMTKEELPNLKEIFFGRGYLMMPLVGIVWLLVTGYTPMLAAFYAIVLSIAAAVLGWWAPLPIGGMVVLFAVLRPIFHVGPYGADGALKYLTEMTPLGALAVLGVILLGFAILKKKPNIGFKEIVGGLESGARSAIGVLSATACAGIIIGVVTKTGLGLKLGTVLVSLANGNLILTLVFTMITSIILGMGVPTTANYIITSTIAAPAIIMILRQKFPGMPVDAISIVLPAHMFAFYFGIVADVTPPVALAAFAGAGIAKANPMKTGLQASRLAIAAFLVPYIFVMNPMMLMVDVTFWPGLLMVLTSMIGIIGVSAGVMGYLVRKSLWWERVLMVGGGILMVYPGTVTDLVGLGLIALGAVSQVARKRLAKA